MSVGIGMGMGHVTLGHGGANPSTDGEEEPTTWSVKCWDTLDQVDHLILLPERALTMDSGWLQADLAEILAHSVIGHVSSSEYDNNTSSSWSASRRRSLDWSLVNSSTGQQSSFVAIATSSDRKFEFKAKEEL